MLLESYTPQSKLVTPTTTINQPRFPVIDVHNHLGMWEEKPLSQLLDCMDTAHIRLCVDLDGGWGENILYRHIDLFKAKAPDRFQVFGGIDWAQWAERGNQFPEWAAQRIRIQQAHGAQGVKVWKPFGLQVKDQNGNLVRIDDSRLTPIWDTAGELGLPIMIHIADPVAFFDPLDETNERWEELHTHPEWAFPSPPYPPFQMLLEGLRALVQRHPATVFIGAHVGCYAENLAWVSNMLDQCSNFFIDISARIGELGRQPFTARKFFLRHQDRILFGTDASPNIADCQVYYRFLETEDEYFNYGTSTIPGQGRWQVYGLNLPKAVLRKVYSSNAHRLLKLDEPFSSYQKTEHRHNQQ